MEFLRFLEGLRTPVMDKVFSFLTMFGEELLVISFALVLVWCVSKKHGYYLFCVGFSGILLNQFLKISLRVPRPWVKDPTLTVVGDAKVQATGYSFPSGHTQIASGLYGGIARYSRNKLARVILVILLLVVAFSRMYLGVHTPQDVIFSLVTSAVLIFVIYPVVCQSFDNVKRMNVLFSVICGINIAFALYVTLHSFPQDIDLANLTNARETAFELLGALLGLWVAYLIDRRYIRYETNALWWVQIIKCVLGLAIFGVIKVVLGNLLEHILGNNPMAGGVEYFVLVMFGLCLWPMTFRLFPKKDKTQ